MDKKYPPIVGKCKERLDNGTCLGCNRLELYDFTGDDDCHGDYCKDALIKYFEERCK